jgi:hypothetical protein
VSLAPHGAFYLAMLAGQMAFLGLAGYGALLEHRGRVLTPVVHQDLANPTRDSV